MLIKMSFPGLKFPGNFLAQFGFLLSITVFISGMGWPLSFKAMKHLASVRL
jgi:hypothetical protein